MKAVAMKVYYVDGEDVKQVLKIAPSKRAITKEFEETNLEILKQVDVTDSYKFNVQDVLTGNLSEEQKEMLTYILKGAGVDE